MDDRASNTSSVAMRTQFRAAALVLIATLFLAAGCGGDGSSYTSPTATRTPAVTATATPVATQTIAPPATRTATSVPTPTPSTAPTSTATTTLAPTSTPTPADTPTATSTATATVANPAVVGPITGPGNPGGQTTFFNLASVGYSQAEYFVAGTANAYINVGELGEDGVWAAAPASSAAYKTRIVVYRPIDANAFNGTVVVEWLNVSGGLDAAPDWTTMHTELIRNGYVWVGVSAQAAGIGPRQGPGPIPGLPDITLKGNNPMRYGSLNHPGDSFSYDMFSQVGQALRSPVGVDPLGGLPRERVIAIGESQSAFRLVTYVNAVHPLGGVYDGFLIHSRGGSGAALSQAPQPVVTMPAVARIRDDLSVPVLTFQTETDLMILGFLPSRQDDGPLFRLWEVAGTAHADTYTLTVGFNDVGTDFHVADVLETGNAAPIPGLITCDSPINSGPQHWVLKAAIAALERWVRDGEAPPTAPRLETAGDPPAYVVDELGNVRGGIRTPYLDAPIAVLSGLGQTGSSFCQIFGTTVLFEPATLASLYPDHETYVAAVNASTDQAIAAGFILEPDGALIKAAAAASKFGT